MKPDTKPDRGLITVLLENTAHMQAHDAAQPAQHIGVLPLGLKASMPSSCIYINLILIIHNRNSKLHVYQMAMINNHDNCLNNNTQQNTLHAALFTIVFPNSCYSTL